MEFALRTVKKNNALVLRVTSLDRKRTMKQNQASLSAAGVAGMRAIEAQKPETERICFDPYARTFANTVLPAGLFYLTKLMVDSGLKYLSTDVYLKG